MGEEVEQEEVTEEVEDLNGVLDRGNLADVATTSSYFGTINKYRRAEAARYYLPSSTPAPHPSPSSLSGWNWNTRSMDRILDGILEVKNLSEVLEGKGLVRRAQS